MASRSGHTTTSQPGPSWADGTSTENEKKHAQHGKPHKPHEHGAPAGKPGQRKPDYKVMYDPMISMHLKTKDFVRRYNGKCGDKYKQFDFPQAPMDPRPKFRRVDQPKNLIVPHFVVDDQYTGIPPKREVTISNLNDNVNKDFLIKMTRNQKLEPQDVQVLYHPGTRKHLEMAHILFRSSVDARLFVEANNGVSVMGKPITCKLDPFAAELNSMYTKISGAPLPPLPYLSGMSEHGLSLRREAIIGTTAPSPSGEAPYNEEDLKRSLSPMDTSMSPHSPVPYYDPLPTHAHQPYFDHSIPQPPPMHYDDAGASTSRLLTPPPPYSELPPSNHGMYEEKRSESRRRVGDSEERARRENRERRRGSMSSSSSDSSGGEGHSGSRRRSDGGVKKREEYLKVKRYVSSERDSNGDKRILKEVKTVTYKRRTEQRTTIDQQKDSPDSFDEEMRRRERSMSRSKRSSEMRGRDDRVVRHRAEQRRKNQMRWSSPSSDSDNGGGRRKRGKERTSDGQPREEERRPPPPADPMPSTPSTSSQPSRRNRGFHSAPIFDPTQPPPAIVPPVGLVLPDVAVPPPPPPMPLSHIMVPPPPLPGGFIPPPEFFGLQSTPAMMSAAAAAAAGMGVLPPSLPPLPPPPLMGTPMMGGYTPAPSATPLPPAAPPAKPVKTALKMQLEEAAAAIAAAVASPSTTTMKRTTSSSSLTASGRTPQEIKAATATPPTPSEGGSTPSAEKIAAEKKEKGNLDDRLSQLFGIRKTKKEEEAAREMRQSSSAPSMAALAGEQMRDEDDMEIDDDDMDVASSSSGDEKIRSEMMAMLERRETEDERRRKEDEERRRKEAEAAVITKFTVDKLVKDLEQQLMRDLNRKLEATAMSCLDKFMKRQQEEGEEKKKQMIRDSLAAAAARDASLVTPKKDPMEELLAAKLMSPEGLSAGGISKVFSSISIVKRKNLAVTDFSRDGTPASRDSRRQSKSRSSSRSSPSSSTASSDEDERKRGSSDDSSSSSEEEEREDEVRKQQRRRRPNMRNIESSQSSAASTSESSDSDESEEKEKETSEKRSDSPLDDVDVVGMSEDEAERIKSECASPSVASPATLAASTSTASIPMEETEVKKEVEGAGPSLSKAPSPPLPPPPAPSSTWSSTTVSPALAAARAAQAELLQQQPSMKPGEDGYHPVRYDHPYVRQLGVPHYDNRTARSLQKPFQQQSTSASSAVPKGFGAKVHNSVPPIPPAIAAATATITQLLPKLPPLAKKEAKKRTGQEKVSNELLSLFPHSEPKKVKEEKKKEKARRIFKKRSEEEEMRILASFKAGIDAEDDKYTRAALEQMQAGGARPFGVDKEVPYESRLRAYTPRELTRPARLGKLDLYFDDNDLAGIVPHPAGCARSQGYYRLTNKQKIRIVRRPEAYQDRTEINERDEVVTRHQVQAQKEQRSMNRRLQTMADSNPNSDFFKVNQLKYRKKMIKFARSRIHGWGLYALEPIAPDDMIVEYIGQKIRPAVADEREKAYERRGIGSSYLFRIDEDEVIDATKQGNFARFINHSCQPNCYAKVVRVDGDNRIVIYSKSLIQKGDEITYDYKFPIEEDKIECLCGAPLCRGTLN